MVLSTLLMIFNKSEIVNYLQYRWDLHELNNLSLYRRLSGFVNQPVVGNIWHCPGCGIWYYIPVSLAG